MSSANGRFARICGAFLFIALLAVPALMFAQEHVVSPADLQKEAVTASSTRQQNVESLQKTFTDPKVQNALKAAKMDPAQVKTAVSSLSDAELAQLSARATHAQKDFAGGRMDDRDLLLILVAIAALILIIVAVR